jgi:hypothetical protein
MIDHNEGNVTNDTFSIVVVSEDNLPPDANAGVDQYIPLDGFGAFITKSTTLIGVESDADGTVASVQWIVIAGPENSLLGSPTNDTTTFAGLISGTYTVRFIVTDNDGATNFHDVNITVLTVYAGADQTTSLPTNSVALVATCLNVADTTNVLWTVISSPAGGYSFTQDGQLSTTFGGLVEGTYVVEVTVTWSIGGNTYSAKDRLNVAVLPAATNRTYRLKAGG